MAGLPVHAVFCGTIASPSAQRPLSCCTCSTTYAVHIFFFVSQGSSEGHWAAGMQMRAMAAAAISGACQTVPTLSPDSSS